MLATYNCSILELKIPFSFLQLQSLGGSQVIITNDPRLTALGLMQYPPLPSNTDPTKIEEIRRTVYVSNLDSTVSCELIRNLKKW